MKAIKQTNLPFYIIILLLIAVIYSQTIDQNKVQNTLRYPRQMYVQKPIYNVSTQRIDPFTRIGYLYKENSDIMLPLHGRRTHVRSYTWNYFTYTNDDSRIRIDINVKNRNCMRKVGCKELYDGDIVHIPELNGLFSVKLYI